MSNKNKMQNLNINIGLFGCVSVGKSTFLNSVAATQYSDTEMKKTTMVPQIYIEDDCHTQNIREINRIINSSISTEPIYHHINKLRDLFDDAIVDSHLKINLYDIPGLNDSTSKNIYFDWVTKNISMFDIIIFITDITKGLNNSDELDILHLLMKSMTRTNNYSKMICLINKCDDIKYDHELNDLIFEETEQENIYIQANQILVNVADNYGLNLQGRITPFLPISSENCFIYRALHLNPLYVLDQSHMNRLGKNECGTTKWKTLNDNSKIQIIENIVEDLKKSYKDKILDTGYITVKNTIQTIIKENYILFVTNHIYDEINDAVTYISKSDIVSFISKINVLKRNMIKAELIILTDKHYDNFWFSIKIAITSYVNNLVSKLPHKYRVINNNKLISFEKFDLIYMETINNCIEYSSIVDSLDDIKYYSQEFFIGKKHQITNIILNIYEELCKIDTYENLKQPYMSPKNLITYLEFIKTYAFDRYDDFAVKFLGLTCQDLKLKYLEDCGDDFILLVEHIKLNISSVRLIMSKIYIILINKQFQIASKPSEFSFRYCTELKELLKTYAAKIIIKNHTFDLLYEMVDKNVARCLSTVYKQELDMKHIEILLDKLTDDNIKIDLEFETKLLNIII